MTSSVFTAVFSAVGPVFLIVALGYGLSRLRSVDITPFTDLIIYVSAPCLVFSSLATSKLTTGELGIMAAGVSVVIIGLFTVAGIARGRLSTNDGGPGGGPGDGATDDGIGRGFHLTATFGNTGNMGIPLALFAFGEQGMALGVVYYVVTTLWHYSLGIGMLGGGGRAGLVEVIRMPLVYAAVLGLGINLIGYDGMLAWLGSETGSGDLSGLGGIIVVAGRTVLRAVTLVGDIAVPMMILVLGYRLTDADISHWRRSMLGSAIKMLGGAALAVMFCAVFDIGGLPRNVLILASSMPPAVLNHAMCEKYHADPALASSTIVLGTLASVAFTPLVLSLLFAYPG